MLPSRFSEKNYWEGGFGEHLTLSDVWNRNASECPDKEAISDSETRLTWGEAKRRIDRLALGLIELDYHQSDVLVVQLPNCVELNLIRIACERAGCLCLPLNPAFRQKEMAYSINFVRAKGIVIPYEFGNVNYYDMIKALRPDTGCLEHIFVKGKRVPEGTIAIDPMLRDEVEKSPPDDWLERTKCKAMEFSTITTTTGTTGFPKFVERAICSYMNMSVAFAEKWKVTDKDTIAVFSPSASGPNVAGYYVAPLAKARVAMLERFYDEAAIRLIEKEKITIIPVVPTMLIKMIEHPKFSSFDLSSLRVIISIGASLPHQVAKDVERKMGAPIVQRYGSVDSGLSSTHSPEESQEVRFRTVGRPVGDAEVKILDDQGDPVKRGEAGEVVVRVKREFSGYFNDLKSTLQSWTADGWYKMGDLGKWDDHGNLVIVGRKKEMIIRGGQNIYPFEIEELLLAHDKVGEIAIIGIPDRTMGERACACIVPSSPQGLISLDEMKAYLREKGVSAYKFPERIAFIEEMPMVAGGQKVDKKTLKKEIVEKLTTEGRVQA